MFGRSFLALCCAAALASAAEPPVFETPLPYSAWLDFGALSYPNALPSALPAWCEGLQTLKVPATAEEPPKTVRRLRILPGNTLQPELLLRVMFDDVAGVQPVVTAWTETGRERFRSQPLGTGLGLPTQEDVVVPLAGTDYIDLEIPGDGSNVRGALAAALSEHIVRQAVDFQQPGAVADPFGNRPPLLLDAVDTKLFGRVKATLEMETISLTPNALEEASWKFDLEAEPLAAVVTFEILNADLSDPPFVTVNDEKPRAASVQWPDLADPAFRGEARGTENQLRFQYTGWLRAQVVVPAGSLHEGLNEIAVALSEKSGPIAIRNVELQLKQNWEHFDYLLNPNR